MSRVRIPSPAPTSPVERIPYRRGQETPIRTPTLHFVEQARRVAELLDQGYSNRRIAAQLGVSAPPLDDLARVEPLLRKGGTHELDASRPLADIVADLTAIAARPMRTS
jgi:hypothetical protein